MYLSDFMVNLCILQINFSFDDMSISHPVAGALQRVELPGVWLHMRQSQHNTHFYCKLQHAQVRFASLLC